MAKMAIEFAVARIFAGTTLLIFAATGPFDTPQHKLVSATSQSDNGAERTKSAPMSAGMAITMAAAPIFRGNLTSLRADQLARNPPASRPIADPAAMATPSRMPTE